MSRIGELSFPFFRFSCVSFDTSLVFLATGCRRLLYWTVTDVRFAYRMAGKYTEVSPEDVIWSNLGMNPYEQKVCIVFLAGRVHCLDSEADTIMVFFLHRYEC